MTDSNYLLSLIFWIGLFVFLTSIFPSMTRSAISLSGANDIAGAGGAVSVLFGIFGKLVIQIIVATGLTFATRRQLSELNMSGFWSLLVFVGLLSGMTFFSILGVSSATLFVLGGVRGLPIPWTLIGTLAFMVFLLIADYRPLRLWSDQSSKKVASWATLMSGTLFALMAIPMAMMVLALVPFIGKIFSALAPISAQIVSPIYFLQKLTGLNVQMVISLVFMLSLLALWFINSRSFEDDDEDDNLPPLSSRQYTPPAQNGFGRRQGFGG